MKRPHLLAIALTGLAALAAAQNNYVEEYDFDNAPPPPRPSRPSTSFRPAPQASSGPRPTPVAILKQIDRHNDDGSYTYGYEGADGSFKIETKLVSGEVMGKYGYVDDTGKVRVVEYGANRYGFMPAGEGITVAPPTLVDETTKKGGRPGEAQEFVDDGSYYQEDVGQIPNLPKRPFPPPRPFPRPRPRPAAQVEEYVPPPPPPPPAPRRAVSSGPAPPRPPVANAAPVFSPAPVYEERPAPQRSYSHPPAQPIIRSEPRYESLPPPPPPQRSAPPQRFAPQPKPQPQRFAPPPQQAPRAQYARSSGGILDQLEQDYALPLGGGQLTHDISFSSY